MSSPWGSSRAPGAIDESTTPRGLEMNMIRVEERRMAMDWHQMWVL